MKAFINGILLVSAVLVSVDVLAVCPGTVVNPTSVLTPDTMIVATAGADSWHEVQCADGRLWDWKLGAGHPTDPSAFVGTWTMTSTSVTHTYDKAYTYELKKAGQNYCLDGVGNQDFPITLKTAPGNKCTE